MEAEIPVRAINCNDRWGRAVPKQRPGASEEGGSGHVSLDLLADLAIEEGWQRGSERFINMLPPNDALRIQGALSPFWQGAWAIFLGGVRNRRVLFVDGSLGSSAIIAARLGARVILLLGSARHARAIDLRVLEMGISENVQILVWRGEEAIPVKDGSVDVACLHNLDAIQKAYPSVRMRHLVREMGRILGPDGVLYVSAPKVADRNQNGINKGDGPFHMFREIWANGFRPYLLLDNRDDLLSPYEIHEIPLQIGGFPWVDAVKWALRRSNYAWIAARPGQMGQAGKRPLEAQLDGFITGRREQPLRVFLGSKSVVRLETDRAIVRIPLSEAGMESCRANHAALVRLETVPRPFAVPKALGSISREISYFVEEKLAGVPVCEQGASGKRSKLAEAGLSLIEDWSRGVRREGSLDESLFRSFIGAAFDLIRRDLPSGQQNEILEIETRFRRRYLGAPMVTAFTHGDFKINNFILNSREDIVGIVDWDRFQEDAPLSLDGLLMLGYNLVLEGNGSYIEAILSLGNHPRERKLLRGHLKKIGVDPDLLPLQQCFAVSHLIIQNGPANIRFRSWWESNISLFLRFLEEI
jgi:SAM-dependent methyltransferase